MKMKGIFVWKQNSSQNRNFTWIDHAWSEHDEDTESNCTCKVCDDIFAVVSELMYHKKGDHKENVRDCWQLAASNCYFVHQKWWFIHENKEMMVCRMIKQ